MSILVRGVRAWGVSVGWGCLILEHWHSPRPPLLWIFIVILVRSWLSCRRKLRLGATSSAPAPRQQVRRSLESWWHAAEGRHSCESSWSGLVTRDTWHSASHMTAWQGAGGYRCTAHWKHTSARIWGAACRDSRYRLEDQWHQTWGYHGLWGSIIVHSA